MSGELHFSFTPDIEAGRDPGGRFLSGYAKAQAADEILNQVREGFRELAILIQAEVAEVYEEKRIREGTTGRLRKATMASGNRKVTQTTIDVGIPSFLDSSSARYWRTIEEGSEVTMPDFVGSEIYGAFLDDGVWGPPNSELAGHGTGIFFPGKRDLEGNYAGDVTKNFRRKLISGKGVIQHDIKAKGAYPDVWTRIGVTERAWEIIDAAIP